MRKFPLLTMAALFACGDLQASSHREAPRIAGSPRLDATDFYMFNSYEKDRGDYVTIIANYLPLQDAYGGPNYFKLEKDGLYDINIDNNGDAKADLTFQFKFHENSKKLSLPIGPADKKVNVEVPLVALGPISAGKTENQGITEWYNIKVLRPYWGETETHWVTRAGTDNEKFLKPSDYIGKKTFPDYDAYAKSYMYDIDIPDCHQKGRVFVGQRKDPFVVNLGEAFDLINTNPLGPVNGERDALQYKNVSSLALEVHKSCLMNGHDPVIAAWTSSSRVVTEGDTTTKTQVSRLANPLVNELVIGLRDKDKFNASKPDGDAAFLTYVTNPTFPAIVEVLFGSAGVKAPTQFPRNDLVSVFLTGVDGLNKTKTPAELMRLNTSIPAAMRDHQNNLGVIAGDKADYPNGRRPGDDVVDISLRVVMGKLLPMDKAPSGQLPYTDGAYVDAKMFSDKFPYLKTPVAGSPN